MKPCTCAACLAWTAPETEAPRKLRARLLSDWLRMLAEEECP